MQSRVPFNFFDYFENIAKKHVSIQHVDDTPGNKALFIVESIAEAFNFISNGTTKKTPQGTALLIQEGYEGNTIEPLSNNEIDRQFYQFWILQHSPGKDFAARKAVFDNCKAIYKQIKEVMKRDKVNNLHGLYFLDKASFSYTQVPPVGDNYMGIAVSFTLLEPDAVKIDPNQWLP
jgi:hypothetical protein